MEYKFSNESKTTNLGNIDLPTRSNENMCEIVKLNIAEKLNLICDIWESGDYEATHNLMEELSISVVGYNAYCDPEFYLENFVHILHQMIFENSHENDLIMAVYCMQSLMNNGLSDHFVPFFSPELFEHVKNVFENFKNNEIPTCIQIFMLFAEVETNSIERIASDVICSSAMNIYMGQTTGEIRDSFARLIFLVAQNLENDELKCLMLGLILDLLINHQRNLDLVSLEILPISLTLLADTPQAMELIIQSEFHQKIWLFIENWPIYPSALYQIVLHFIKVIPDKFSIEPNIMLKSLDVTNADLRMSVLMCLKAAIFVYENHPIFFEEIFIKKLLELSNDISFPLRKTVDSIACLAVMKLPAEIIDVYVQNGVVDLIFQFINSDFSYKRVDMNVHALQCLLVKGNSDDIVNSILENDGVSELTDIADDPSFENLSDFIQIEILSKYFEPE